MSRLAFMTVSALHEPYDHPRTQGFIQRTPATFAAAEASEGFIMRSMWPDPVDTQIWGEWAVPKMFQSIDYPNLVPPTLSLWKDIESVFAFAYNGPHAEAFSQRRDWFAPMSMPGYVAWWVADDHIPNWQEACARFDLLESQGPTPEAFNFKHPFGPDGQPIQIDREAIRRKAAVHKGSQA
jgi:hypothetical protein